jgi:predicted DNA-binding protein (UPF0251 family)
MGRPRKPRNLICPHRAGYDEVFKPAGIPLGEIPIIALGRDELDALHLCDGEGKTQEEAGACMGVSRGTVQRLLSSARRNVAQALVRPAALAISGAVKTGKEAESGASGGGA